MNKSVMRVYAVPGAAWQNKESSPENLYDFVVDALSIERRIIKEVNLNNERMRYQLCCRRIQEIVRGMDLVENITLGQHYFDILKNLYKTSPSKVVQTRLLSCFHLPNGISNFNGRVDTLLQPAELGNHLETVIRLLNGKPGSEPMAQRIKFLKIAAEQGAGIVEIADFHVPGNENLPDNHMLQSMPCPRPAEKAADELSTENDQELLDILKSKIETAIRTNTEVNFSNQPHPIITEALNEFVYKDEKNKKETSIRVVYMDGTEGEPFPLRCLERKENLNGNIPHLKASLISMRHLEMDKQVDFAWFRNKKVSCGKSCAETDLYCTEQTIELLKNLTTGPIHLHLYQTGLETAVIGFYRGLVKHLIDPKNKTNTARVQITPYYYSHKNGGSYTQGKIWT